MPQHAQLTAGQELAGYRIETLAGRGGMGEVYRAVDARLGRNVALKLLASRLADDDRFRERFLRESRLAAGIDHPNVIPVYEAGEAEGSLFIAMRYVEGTDLRRVLDEEGALDPARTVALLAPVAGALDTAHARGLVHRDVKPANMLIAVEPDPDPAEHVYLSDFGLTTLSSDPADGLFSGTADYAAPELVTGGEVDGRADVYALGCVMFECLTGQPPFARDSAMAVLWGHVNDPVPSAHALVPKLPVSIDEVIGRALAKEPAKRYSTCRELVESARDALGVTGIEVPRAARRRRTLLVAGVAIGAAIVAASLLAFFLTRGGGSPPPATGGTLVRIDPATDEATQTFRVGEYPTAVSAASDGVWVAAFREGSLWRIDPVSLAVTRVPAEGTPYDLVSYAGTVYVAAEGPEVSTGNVVAYDASNGHRIDGLQLLACALTAGREGVWAAGCPSIDLLSRGAPLRILRKAPIPFQSPRDAQHDRLGMNDMALWDGSLWVLGDAGDRRIWRVDPRDGTIERTFELSFPPGHLAAGAGGVWVTDQLGDAVVRLDPASGRIVARIPVGPVASGVAVGAGSVWATSYLGRTVSRIDPRANKVVETIRVAGKPRDISVGGGAVWAVGDAR